MTHFSVVYGSDQSAWLLVADMPAGMRATAFATYGQATGVAEQFKTRMIEGEKDQARAIRAVDALNVRVIENEDDFSKFLPTCIGNRIPVRVSGNAISYRD